MTDREYEIIDALYFTVSFDFLKMELETEESVLVTELIALIKKDWVKCLEKVSEIEIEDIELVAKNYTNYNFLASKKGLTIHNSR